MEPVVVVDTNVLVSAMLGRGADNRFLGECLRGRFLPIVGAALLAEYESVLSRGHLFAQCRLDAAERGELLDIFLAKCRWVRIYFAWRPNLRDEGDNHLIELGVAGGASLIVTSNVRDLRSGELKFPGLRAVTAREALEE